jgi:uncharacterized protein YdaU (DUF1376 family)
MRHFAHHIGDYAAATAHLSFVEDAAYHRLLRRYYQDEKPLPTDLVATQRLVGARSREEREAVKNVLEEFFKLTERGWVQVRADREIEAYRIRAEIARENGNRGGRPHKPKPNPEETHPVPEGKLTNNHEPITKEREPRTGARLPEDWDLDETLASFAANLGLDPAKVAASFKDYWRGVAGAKGRKADWPGTWRNWCRREAETRQNTDKMRTKPGQAVAGLPAPEEWGARINGYRAGGFWQPTWGPRPEESGCRVPAPILAAWRQGPGADA